VIVKPRRNEEAQAHIGLSSYRRERVREREREQAMKGQKGSGGIALLFL
jgi:hypothetical protein